MIESKIICVKFQMEKRVKEAGSMGNLIAFSEILESISDYWIIPLKSASSGNRKRLKENMINRSEALNQ
ncbi:hypothetical protein [Sporocytophaga myxococcoides]|uniref:hypothetical protein n=1 Tax=Sporocytophaga myxococcoides TaxID=153721 RepID=UPI0004091878|nr:hypothetical protein [Sporocytophaga myxococcoides]